MRLHTRILAVCTAILAAALPAPGSALEATVSPPLTGRALGQAYLATLSEDPDSLTWDAVEAFAFADLKTSGANEFELRRQLRTRGKALVEGGLAQLHRQHRLQGVGVLSEYNFDTQSFELLSEQFSKSGPFVANDLFGRLGLGAGRTAIPEVLPVNQARHYQAGGRVPAFGAAVRNAREWATLKVGERDAEALIAGGRRVAYDATVRAIPTYKRARIPADGRVTDAIMMEYVITELTITNLSNRTSKTWTNPHTRDCAAFGPGQEYLVRSFNFDFSNQEIEDYVIAPTDPGARDDGFREAPLRLVRGTPPGWNEAVLRAGSSAQNTYMIEGDFFDMAEDAATASCGGSINWSSDAGYGCHYAIHFIDSTPGGQTYFSGTYLCSTPDKHIGGKYWALRQN